VRSGEEEPTPAFYRAAVRDVIRTCIYAVDKNPLAVDLCKVALWIEGYNTGLPLNFLDHHVKCGDSLVGVFDLNVLTQGIPDEAYAAVEGDDKRAASYYRKRNQKAREGQLSFDTLQTEGPSLSGFVADFTTLTELDDRTPGDVQAKATMYEALRGGPGWYRLKTACDTWTAAFFAKLEFRNGDQPAPVPTTDVVRQVLAGSNATNNEAVAWAVGLSEAHPFFHWLLEFPDVFQRQGFDVVVSNPPFSGGLKISERLGGYFRKYLTASYTPARGVADLCAYFVRRGFNLLRVNGCMGMVATNSIGQGDSREGGLAVVLEQGGAIFFGRRFIKWPGAANVEVNLMAVRKGTWHGIRLLDGQPVAFISSRLDEETESEPLRLQRNRGIAFQGSIPLSTGFIVESPEARRLIEKDPLNKACLYPYLTGEDLNSRPDQSPSRWIIQFDERTEAQARMFTDLWEIVQNRVYPERRDKDPRKYPRMVNEWWKHWNNRQALYEAIAPLNRALARSRVSELHMLAFVPTNIVYGDVIVVFAYDDYRHFAVLQSAAHEIWIRHNASTMRTDVRYTPTDCLETFPLPEDIDGRHGDRLTQVGRLFYESRQALMMQRNVGLTKVYNLLHDQSCQDRDIARFRELQCELDQSVLIAYDWTDLDMRWDFSTNERDQTRYGLPLATRREVLQRLGTLNQAMASQESFQFSGSRSFNLNQVGAKGKWFAE
jgi:hypothetical protein